MDFGKAGGQEEKFRDLSHRVRWTKDDLRELLDSRVVVAAAHSGLADVDSIGDLLPHPNKVMGDPLDYILSRTLLRPRDAIAFLNECFALAGGKEKLSWEGIHSAELAYSAKRLLALRDEWKPTFPGIEQLLKTFARTSSILNQTEMASVLDDCALLTMDRDFEGTVWLTELTEPVWSGSAENDLAEMYQPIIRLLHNIGFIGCILSDSQRDRTLLTNSVIYGNDDPNFPDSVSNLCRVAGFVVHPAFRTALDISPLPTVNS